MNSEADMLAEKTTPVVSSQKEARGTDMQPIEPSNGARVDSMPEKDSAQFFGINVSGSAGKKLSIIQRWGARWRQNAITNTPRVIVNHSSNLIGFMQFIAEAFMFRSSGYDLLNKKTPQMWMNEKAYATWAERPLMNKIGHYLFDPPKNILDGVFTKGGLGIHPLQEKFYSNMPERIGSIPERIEALPKKISALPEKLGDASKETLDAFRHLGDTKAATVRDRIAPGGGFNKLTNKWSARSSFSGLCAMAIAAVLPDKKDTPEETEKYMKMSREHPISYVTARLYQAVNPLQWWNHKRQFSGLGMMCAGVFSLISGFRQVAGKDPGKQLYMRNYWQMAGGAITALGGTQLMLAIDNDSGWRNFGLTQMLRLTTLPASIITRYNGVKVSAEEAAIIGLKAEDFKLTDEARKQMQEQGAGHYFAAQGVLQAKNIFASSVGGAEKDKEGNIVDHQKIRTEALIETRKEIAINKAKRLQRRSSKDEAVTADQAVASIEPVSSMHVTPMKNADRIQAEREDSQIHVHSF